MSSKAGQLKTALSVYKDVRVWFNVAADVTPALFMLIMFLIPPVRDFLGLFGFVTIVVGFVGSNLVWFIDPKPNFLGVQVLLPLVFAFSSVVGAFLGYATMLWAGHSPGVLLVIAFVVFFFTGFGGFGDPNNGLAILFSMGAGIVFITALAFSYPLTADKYPPGYMESQALFFAKSMSLNFALGAIASSVFHAIFSLISRDFARLRFVNSSAAALRILSQLGRIDRACLKDEPRAHIISKAKILVRQLDSDATAFAASATLDELFLCNPKRGAACNVVANALHILSEYVVTVLFAMDGSDSHSHHTLLTLKVMTEPNLFKRILTSVSLYTPLVLQEEELNLLMALPQPVSSSMGKLRERVMLLAADYLDTCAVALEAYPNTSHMLPGLGNELEQAKDALAEIKQSMGDAEQDEQTDMLMASLDSRMAVLTKFHTVLYAFLAGEDMPKLPKPPAKPKSKPSLTKMIMALAAFQRSDLAVRCFRFAIGGTVLLSLAISRETVDFFTVFSMTSAISSFYSMSSQSSLSALIIRLLVRVLGIGFGVAIASLVFLTMGSGYNYVSLIVAHVLVLFTAAAIPHFFGNGTNMRLILMMIVGGFCVALDQSMMLYHFMGYQDFSKTAYILGGKYMMVNTIGAALMILSNLLIAPQTTKDLVDKELSKAVAIIRDDVTDYLRSAMGITGSSSKNGESSSVEMSFADESSTDFVPYEAPDPLRFKAMQVHAIVVKRINNIAELTRLSGLDVPLRGPFSARHYFEMCNRVMAVCDWLVVLELIHSATPHRNEHPCDAVTRIQVELANALQLLSAHLSGLADYNFALKTNSLLAVNAAHAPEVPSELRTAFERVTAFTSELAIAACDTAEDDDIYEWVKKTL